MTKGKASIQPVQSRTKSRRCSFQNAGRRPEFSDLAVCMRGCIVDNAISSGNWLPYDTRVHRAPRFNSHRPRNPRKVRRSPRFLNCSPYRRGENLRGPTDRTLLFDALPRTSCFCRPESGFGNDLRKTTSRVVRRTWAEDLGQRAKRSGPTRSSQPSSGDGREEGCTARRLSWPDAGRSARTAPNSPCRDRPALRCGWP